MYVVVNMTQTVTWARGSEWRYVMPQEDPHTYDTVEEAVRQVANLAVEYGHDLDTAVIFELVPVEVTQEMEGILANEVSELTVD